MNRSDVMLWWLMAMDYGGSQHKGGWPVTSCYY